METCPFQKSQNINSDYLQHKSPHSLMILIDELSCTCTLFISRFFRIFKVPTLANAMLFNLSFLQKLAPSDS